MSTHRPIGPSSTLTLVTETAYAAYWALDGPRGAVVRRLQGEHEYLLSFWLPILGPTPIAARQRLLLELDEHGEPTNGSYLTACRDVPTIATTVGVSPTTLADNLWRAMRHGFWTHADTEDGDCVWAIPRIVPRLPERILERRPGAFQAAHAAFCADRGPRQAWTTTSPTDRAGHL